MKKSFLLLPVFCVMIGCSSMPGRIDEAWLADATADDEKLVIAHEEDIIRARKDLENARRRRQIAEQQLTVAREKRTASDARIQALKEEEKLHSMNQDQEKLTLTRTSLDEAVRTSAIDKSMLALAEVYLEYSGIQVEARSAELNVRMARLDFVRARIAGVWHEKNTGPAQEKAWYQKLLPDDSFKVDDYEKNVQNQEKRRSAVFEKRASIMVRLRKAIDDYSAVSGGQTPKWVVYEE